MALLQKAYLGATPLFREQSWFEEVSAKPVNSSSRVTITADSTAHVKGAWSQLIASTSANASYIIIEVGSNATGTTNMASLLDIGIGASGSETAFIENIGIGGAADGAGRAQFTFGVPYKIASGSRISARFQSVITGGKTAAVTARIFDMGDYNYAPTAVDTIGADTATSQGTAMSGASGTWVQMIASTANAYRGFVIVPSYTDASFSTNRLVEYTLGVGAASSEVEQGITGWQYMSDQTVGMNGRYPPFIKANIAAGSRLAIKHDLANNPTRFDATLIGIR